MSSESKEGHKMLSTRREQETEVKAHYFKLQRQPNIVAENVWRRWERVVSLIESLIFLSSKSVRQIR